MKCCLKKGFVALLCLVQIALRLCVVLLAVGLKAQVSVQLTAPAGQRMLVGVNGYLQHSQPSHAVLLQGLDTGQHSLEILLLADSTAYFRTVRLPAGSHFYQLTKEGDHYRWRYAETGPKPDREVVVHQKAAWSPGPRPTPAQATTPPPPASTPPAALAEAPVIAPIPVVAEQASVVEAAPPAENQRPPLPVFQKNDYEFERLQKSLAYGRAHGLTHQDLTTLVQVFRYENSKLDFLIRAYPLALEPQRFAELQSNLEYPASRERLAAETWKK